ncbi:protein PML-like [Hypanus sabinus]|uniref:protein PML-like n=1 Tax=Hypanus sabinus TaxID=79690 RepID=UPI0028C3DE55|nr:protein PML-like [Hypanus sabinus]
MAKELVTSFEEIFQCYLCSRPTTSPKLLQCLHTFCAGCLERECQQDDVKCPICEMVTHSSVSSLRDNILVSNLQNSMRKQQQIMGSGELHCASCEGVTLAEYMCPECDKLLCSKCLAVHQVLMADHTKHVQTLGTLRKLNSDEFLKILRRSKELPCSIHEDQQINLFCRTCSSWLCVLCVLLEHKDHNCITVRKQITLQKDELRDTLTDIERSQENFEKFHTQLEELVDKLNKDRYKLEDMIKARVAAALEKVKEEERRLLSELEELHLSKTRKFQECLTSTQNVLRRMAVSRNVVSQLLRYATDEELLRLQGMIKLALNQLQAEKPMDVQVENSIIDFKECCVFPKKMLGSLIITRMMPESTSEQNFKSLGCDVAAPCNKEVGETSKCNLNKRKRLESEEEQVFKKPCQKEESSNNIEAEETQVFKKPCLKEEPSNHIEALPNAGPGGTVQSPSHCIENVISVVDLNGQEQTDKFQDITAIPVEMIQIDSEDSS